MRSLLAVAALAFAAAVPAHAESPAPRTGVPGEKVDSGLGQLPPFIEWHRHPQLRKLAGRSVARAEGEKVDSGLGDLPPYSQWRDHPELKALAPKPASGAVTAYAR
jgi:hypothetical protein